MNSIDFTYKSSSKAIFDVTILDHSRSLRKFKLQIEKIKTYGDNNSHDLDAIPLAVKKLHECSIFSDWKQFDLEQENKDLRAKNERLKKQIAKLRTEAK